ncbi:MAG: proline/glycine betaine ABC transporter permease, partial [Spirochaetaceae bacterium]
MFDFTLPRIPLGEGIEAALEWLRVALSPLTRAFSEIVEIGIEGLVSGLGLLPPVVLAVIIAALAWWAANRNVAIFALIGLLFVWNIGLWPATLSTIALVLISTIIAVALGIPIGIIAGLSEKFHNFIKPILDFMQTMPAFVYL